MDHAHLVSFRQATPADLPEANKLCMRSKAHWGYDPRFLEACREELTISPKDLENSDTILAVQGPRIIGLAQTWSEATTAQLDKLFIDPDSIGKGVGKALFHQALNRTKAKGVALLELVADPYAAPFYEKLGFERIGEEPSVLVKGRNLGVYRLAV